MTISFPLPTNKFSGLSRITDGFLVQALNQIASTTDEGNASAISALTTTVSGHTTTIGTHTTTIGTHTSAISTLQSTALTSAQRVAVTALTAITTDDATDLATAEALANACKVKINAIIAALQHA
jgi:hypothetical protein